MLSEHMSKNRLLRTAVKTQYKLIYFKNIESMDVSNHVVQQRSVAANASSKDLSSSTESSCFTNQNRKNFLVCITIHKAKNLPILNADTYVAISLDGTTKRTATAQNTDCPFFNEYFVFEQNCSVSQLLRLNVSLKLLKKTCCAKKDELIGEVILDVNTVWTMKGILN